MMVVFKKFSCHRFLSPLILVPIFGCGCSPARPSTPNSAEVAKARSNKIVAGSTASDVALTEEERRKFYANVERDSLADDSNTILLIGTAFRNSAEKQLLMKEIPRWFSSPRIETRCMAFKMVKLLKLSQFDGAVDRLKADLGRKQKLSPLEKIELEDMTSYRDRR
jgi:hypothetical protein